MAEHTPIDIPLAKPAAPGALLNYSAPHTFLEAGYRHRSLNQLIGGAVVLVMGAFVTWMWGHSYAAGGGLAFVVGRAFLGLIALGCFALVAWLAWKWAQNAFDPVRITEEGIEHRRRVHPWEEIASVGGMVTLGGVLVEYQLRTLPDRPHAWLLPEGLPRALLMSPPLKRPQFDALISVLQTYLAQHHPHVRLNPEPRIGGD